MKEEKFNKIISFFGLSYDQLLPEEWIHIKCPLHEDNHKSGGIKFNVDDGKYTGRGYFQCHSGCGGGELRKIMRDNVNISIDDSIEVLKQKIENTSKNLVKQYNEQNKPIKRVEVSKKTIIEKYEAFLEEKGLKQELIEELGGTLIQDINSDSYGYLVFKYGNKNQYHVGRNIFVSGERFINSKGNKALLGNERIKLGNYKEVILVEGLTDYLAMLQNGFYNTVCSLSAGLSKEQAYQLKGKTVFILYDPDLAGYQGTEHANKRIKEFKGNPINLEIYSKPEFDCEKADVNYLLKFDNEAFILFLNSAISKYSTYDNDYIKNTFFKMPQLKYYSTGNKQWDNVLGGGFTQGLHSFAGNPGIGKSTLSVALARNLIGAGAKVLYCTYELSKNQIWSRIISGHLGYKSLTWQQIERDKSSMVNAYNLISSTELIARNIKVISGYTIEDIVNSINNFDVFIIDYFQKMPLPKGMEERQGLKYILKEITKITEAEGSGKLFILISEIPRSQYYSDQDRLDIFKETGGVEYSSQSCYRLTKIGNDHLDIAIIKNTRGITGKVLRTKVNYEYQTITETTMAESLGI